ncbi:MAG: hypothetical protein R8M45_09015 [Ghiorsea sp.]
MIVHTVTSVTDADVIEERIKKVFPDKWLKADAGQWFVAADLTSQQVAEKLGVYEDRLRCIILTVTSYNGLHDSNTWEWLELQRGL